MLSVRVTTPLSSSRVKSSGDGGDGGGGSGHLFSSRQKLSGNAALSVLARTQTVNGTPIRRAILEEPWGFHERGRARALTLLSGRLAKRKGRPRAALEIQGISRDPAAYDLV